MVLIKMGILTKQSLSQKSSLNATVLSLATLDDATQNRTNPKEGKSASRLCHQVAAWVPDMFYNFYLVKSYKIANNSATNEAREKIITDL
jgi:hypothetical protein